MGVVIEREEQWQPKSVSYVFLLASCVASISLFAYFSKSSPARGVAVASSSLVDLGPTALFLRFQRSFLILYTLASVIEGLEWVFGEYEFAYYGIGKEQKSFCLAAEAAAALLIGSFSGILSDIIWEGGASITYLPMLSWFKNAWEHCFSMVLRRGIITPQ